MYDLNGSFTRYVYADFEKVDSPVSVAHFSQYKLTALLVKKLQEIGFTFCDTTGPAGTAISEKVVLMGHECLSIDATSDCIDVTASYCKGDQIVKTNYHCDFLIGTDGAGSAVRKLIGVDMIGERDLQKLVSVHFMSKDLGLFLTNERPGMLFFIFNAEAIGVLVAHDLEQGEFVLQVRGNFTFIEICDQHTTFLSENQYICISNPSLNLISDPLLSTTAEPRRF